MNSADPKTVTWLLHAARDGDQQAFDRLYEKVYNELHRLAGFVRLHKAGDTLNTTSLVHEAYIKLIPSSDHNWQDRTHFFRVAARAMRQILVNTARSKHADKRYAGSVAVTFQDDLYEQKEISSADIIALDSVLDKLEELDPRQAKIVECRFFVGMNVDETAHALDVSPATVKRDWRLARAWLIRELGLSES
jgi:RNA polymerase sigma factor (TIGR02999 family)